MYKIGFLVISLFGLFSGCSTYSESEKNTFDTAIQKFIQKSGIKYQKSESGLYYFIENEGEGDNIKYTNDVSFTYSGKLLNGTPFDTKNSRTPVTFNVKQLILGWQEAMLYLKKGGKAKLIVPPHLGYANYELESIPKNSILTFEMEIVDVK